MQTRLRHESNHPTDGTAIDLLVNRGERQIHVLPTAIDDKFHGFALAGLNDLLKCIHRLDRQAIGAQQQIAPLKSGLLRRHSGGEFTHLDLGSRRPADRTDSAAIVEHRSYGCLNGLAIALQGNVEQAACGGNFFQANVIPGRIALAVEANNQVTLLDAGLRRRGVLHQVANEGPLIGIRQLFELYHEQAREQADGEDDVHERAGESDNQALPSRLREEAARVIHVLIARLLAGHLDVTAKQDGREPVIRVAFAEPEQARTKPEAEHLHANVEPSRGPEVAGFVDDDHHADEHQQPENILHDKHRIKLSPPAAPSSRLRVPERPRLLPPGCLAQSAHEPESATPYPIREYHRSCQAAG